MRDDEIAHVQSTMVTIALEVRHALNLEGTNPLTPAQAQTLIRNSTDARLRRWSRMA